VQRLARVGAGVGGHAVRDGRLVQVVHVDEELEPI
jgi:hypothetical protein